MSNILYVDFMKDIRVEKEDYLKNPKEVCQYIDNQLGLDEIYDEFKAFIERNRYVGFDIETSKENGRDIKKNDGIDFRRDKLSVIQASDGFNTYVFNVNNLTKKQFMPFIDLLITVGWVGHNIKFDTKFVLRDYGKRSDALFDTEIAAKSIICEPFPKSYSFQNVMKEEMNINLPKEAQIANWGAMIITYGMIGYAARDAYYSVLLKNHLTDRLNAIEHLRTANKESKYIKIFDVWHKLFHMEMESLIIFTDMEDHGIMLDREETFAGHYKTQNIEQTRIREIIDFLGGIKFNPRSPIQVMNMFKKLYPTQGRINEEGKFEFISQIENMNKDTLKFFIGKGMPFVDMIYDFKRLTGQIQRLEEFTSLMDINDRVYPDLRAWGAVTGRTSCKKPNLQNIKNIRDAHTNPEAVNLKALFKAPEGSKLIVVDFSQIQLVIIAAMTKDPLMMEIINTGPETGLDLHIQTAANVNNIDPKDVTKAQRTAAKAVNFGYCILYTNPVVTQRGKIPIGDVVVGDSVLTHKGNWKKVTKVFRRTVDKVVELTTRTGKTVTATPEHMWRLQNPSANGRPSIQSWLEADEFKEGMYMVPNLYEYLHPVENLFEDKEAIRILGWALSDGVIEQVEGGHVIHIDQSQSLNPVEYQNMHDILVYENGFDPNPRFTEGNFRFTSPVIKDIKSYTKGVSLPTSRKLLRERNFSEIVNLMSREEKTVLLGALWDGDGSIVVTNDSKINIAYYSVSLDLVTNIQDTLESLGILSKVTMQDANAKETTTHMLRIVGSHSAKKFLDIVPSTKVARTVYNPKRQFSAEEMIVSKVVKEGQFDVCDLTVEDDHSFVAGGLVSHNCFGMGWPSFIMYALLQYDVHFTDAEAKNARDKFFSGYKGIASWHRDVQGSRRGGRYFCRSLYGREMWAFNFTDATNYPVQAVEAIILKMSVILIKQELIKKGLFKNTFLVNVVHDEVVYEALENQAEDVFEIICRCMSEAGRIVLKGILPVRVEGHIVNRWSEAK